jgi:hypothetical protein
VPRTEPDLGGRPAPQTRANSELEPELTIERT